MAHCYNVLIMVKASDTSSPNPNLRLSINKIIGLLLFLVALYVLLPQFGNFRKSIGLLRHANAAWLLIALCSVWATYFVAAFIYVLLTKHKLRYVQTVAIQVASMFANRLLPAGIGAIGVSYKYLRKNKHTATEAGAVVAANNALGFIGNVLLIAGTLLFTRSSITGYTRPHFSLPHFWIIIGLLLLIIIGVVWIKKAGKSLGQTVRKIFLNLIRYKTHPLKLSGALMSSVCLTALYSLGLLACVHSIHANISFLHAIVVLTIGVAGGTIIPTPGGLGTELALISGLVIYNISSPEALAAVLVYRLLTYWLALILGALAFGVVAREQYI